jgi:hypothetical protein
VPLKISIALLNPEPSMYSEKNRSAGVAAPAGAAAAASGRAPATAVATAMATFRRKRILGP